MQKGNLFLYEGVIILLSWIRVFIPNLAQKHGCPIFFLFSNFLAPLRDLTNTVRDVYFFVRGRIIFGDVFLSISNIAQFHFCRKKTYLYCERRIFSISREDNFWRCIFSYPQYCTIFICADKNRKTNTGTDKQHLKLECLAKTEKI